MKSKNTKTLFIPAKFKSKVNKSKILDASKNLPKNLVIAYSVQFQDIAKEIKSILSNDNHNVLGFNQVLGCTKINSILPDEAQAVLLISTGRFHAMSLAYSSSVPIYILDKNKLEKISKRDLEVFHQKQKASYMRFLNASQLGILVSLKPGQNRLKKAIKLKKKLAKKQKNPYLFLCNNASSLEFENFPNIQSWVNTACPRLDMDSNAKNTSAIINIENIKNF